MMKVTDIERINIEENQVLNSNNIQDFIEQPLIESIEMFNEKGIKTLMSSCNKHNVKWINDEGKNIFTEDLRSDLRYKDIYSFGYGFAYIMLDFDSLDDDNKKTMEKLYIKLNDGIEDKPQTQSYSSNKVIIYGAVPTAKIVGDHEYDANGFRKRPGMYFSFETIKEDALTTDDNFFLNNYNVVPTSTQTPRVVIIRYPVNEDTKTTDVTTYFNGIANMMVKQEVTLGKNK